MKTRYERLVLAAALCATLATSCGEPTFESVMRKDPGSRSSLIGKITDGETLARLAVYSNEPATERAAFGRLKQSSLFTEGGFPIPVESREGIFYILADGSSDVCKEAMAAFAAAPNASPEMRKAAIRKLRNVGGDVVTAVVGAESAVADDDEFLTEVLSGATNAGLERLYRLATSKQVRKAATSLIRDETLLATIAKDDSDEEVRLAANARCRELDQERRAKEQAMARAAAEQARQREAEAAAAAIRTIMNKAENADGISIGGFYSGMSRNDAITLCKYYAGESVDVSSPRNTSGSYRFEQAWDFLMRDEADWETTIKLNGKEFAVLYGDGQSEYSSIYGFVFFAPAIRKLSGKTSKNLSAQQLGYSFFEKNHLDSEWHQRGLKFKSAGGKELIIYSERESKVYWDGMYGR